MNEKNIVIIGWFLAGITALTAPLVQVFGPEIRDLVLRPEAQVFLREKNPKEINKLLNNLHPLQRESFINENFLNRWVNWAGEVKQISKSRNGSYFVLANYSKPWELAVWLEFDESWRPKLEALRLGDLINYKGKISRIDLIPLYMSLTNVDFELLPLPSLKDKLPNDEPGDTEEKVVIAP